MCQLLRFLCFACLLVPPGGSVGAFAQTFRPLPESLNEISGMAVVDSDSIYVINDGGNGPLLHVIDRCGTVRHTYPIAGTSNQDWESLARDERGRLYLCDVGNNNNDRRNLRIYRYDPRSRAVDTIAFRYPDQSEYTLPRKDWRYDLEAVAWWGDSLHLFTKNRIREGDYTTTHYTLPDRPGDYVAQLRERFALKKKVITGAAIHPDGTELVLLTYDVGRFLGVLPYFRAAVFRYRRFEKGFANAEVTRIRLPGLLKRQYEAIDYLNATTLLIGAERSFILAPRLLELPLK